MPAVSDPVNTDFLSPLDVCRLFRCTEKKLQRMIDRARDGLYPLPPGRQVVAGRIAYRNDEPALCAWFDKYKAVYPAGAKA